MILAHESSTYMQWLAPLLALIGILGGIWLKFLVEVRMQKREMKRIAYMDAATAVHESIAIICRLVDVGVSANDVNAQFAPHLAPLARAQVVAKDKLCIAISEMIKFLQSLYTSLIEARMPGVDAHNEILIINEWLDKYQAQIDSNLNDQNQYNLEGRNNPAQWRILTSNFEFLQGQLESFQQKREERHLALLRCTVKINDSLAEKMCNEFPELITNGLSCIRKELGFKFNKTAYLALQNEMADFTRGTIDHARELIDAKLKADEEANR